MPVLLFLGKDDFTKGEALAELRARVGPPEVAVTNVSTLEGAQVTLEELVQVCSAVPFLAAERLIVVTGLLARFEPRDARRRGGRGRRPRTGDLGPWAQLCSYLEQGFPPTTTLVLVDGAVGAENPLLVELQPVAQVRRFTPLSREEVQRWIRTRMQEREQAISPAAVALLEELLANDLWSLSQELQKLALYTQGSRAIEVEDVRLLVWAERETTVFRFVDAALEGRPSAAMASLQSLLQEGATAGYLLGMLGRQVRLLLQAQEALAEGLTQEEVGRRVGLRPGFPLRRVVEQARRHSLERLYAFHHALLEADLAIKRGVMEEATALELLTGQLSVPSP